MILSPGLRTAAYTARFALVPLCGCTLACSAPKSFLARAMQMASPLSTFSHPQ